MGTPIEEQRIAILPELVRNQIAAGEVIERPASVVKELVENALDAGATHVQLDLEEGGVKLVRVTDDGCGIGRPDLELCFAAHATSKLRDASDLDHIATLGFRGEALASIGSVARCRVYSRLPERDTGYAIENRGGRLEEVRESGGPRGTIVEVRDLFFNTPARRRFLRTTQTELGRCLDILQRVSLAHEGVGFVATHDGRRVLDIEASMDRLARIRRIFGADLASELVPVEGEDGDTRLSGFVAPPRFSRRDTSRQIWLLNGRPLRDKILTRCLRDAYRGFLVEGRQPVAFLSLSMDPRKVDVNVHPAKSEVRFREERRLFGFLVNAIRESVRTTDMSTPGERLIGFAARREEAAGGPRTFALPDPGGLGAAGGERRARPEAIFVREGAPAAPAAESFAASAPGGSPAPTLRDPADDPLVGPFLQVGKTFLLRAVPDGFEIVDQHALHERLTYDGLLSDCRAGKVEVQNLLVPDVVELGRAQVERLEEHFGALETIGIFLTRFGPTSVAVNGLPARLRKPDAEGVVRDVLEVIETTGKPPDHADVIEDVLHRTACRSSIMAGDELSQDEIRALLERARELESDQTCPHARPTRVRFAIADLEKAFHRR